MNQARESTPTILYIYLSSLSPFSLSLTHIPTRSLQSNHRFTQNKIKTKLHLSLPSLAPRIDQSPPIHAISKQTFFLLVPNFKNKSSLGEQLRLHHHHHHDRRRRRHHQQHHQHSPCHPWFLQFPVRDYIRRERELKRYMRYRQTDNRQREKRGKDRETRSEIMEREGEKACDLVFFFFFNKTSALHNEKSEIREEREKREK